MVVHMSEHISMHVSIHMSHMSIRMHAHRETGRRRRRS